jgi:hypothetical protein
VQRDTKEVLAELVGGLKEKQDPKKVAATSAEEKHPRGELRPNLDRLTVGVDLGDQWSNYCIVVLEGENAGGGTVAYDAGGHYRILSGRERGSALPSDFMSGIMGQIRAVNERPC